MADVQTEARLSGLLAIGLRKFFNAVGYTGGLLIIYSLVAIGTGEYWQPLEKWIRVISASLTLVSTILTAGSIYFYSERSVHAPERFSRWISGPAVIASAFAAFCILLWRGSLPEHVTSGFALLAIAGAWFRIQARTIE